MPIDVEACAAYVAVPNFPARQHVDDDPIVLKFDIPARLRRAQEAENATDCEQNKNRRPDY
jgi:hypothetical protein